MKQKLLYFAMFAAGSVIGSAVAWRYAKKKYETIAEEEIQSVKEAFLKKQNELNNRLSEVNNLLKEKIKEEVISKEHDDIDSTPDIDEPEEHEDYEAVLKKNKYYRDDRPYIITQEDFKEGVDGYNTVTLYCYADGVIADEDDEIIDHVDETIGNESVNYFENECFDDCIYVRNDTLKCDYEILRSEKEYSDVTN